MELRRLRPNYECQAIKDEVKQLNAVSSKKLHEIQNLSNLIDSLIPSKDTTLIIDFGSGLGYLSEMLSSRYHFKVLGIEGDQAKVDSALKRLKTSSPDVTKKIQYTQHFITESSNEFIEQQIATIDPTEAVIVGLHSCADLTITAIKLFHQIEKVKKLMIMSCCYHRQLKNETKNERFQNLPLSKTFKAALDNVPGSEDMINVAFARLACQHSAVRWRKLSIEDHVQHGHTMFERALVELIPLDGEHVRRNNHTRQVHARSFEEVKLKYSLLKDNGEEVSWQDVHKKRYEEFVNRYPSGDRLSQYLKCLQNCIQGLCEHVIMMDRYAYILEFLAETGQTVKNLEYRKITDDEISPRGFVLIVEK